MNAQESVIVIPEHNLVTAQLYEQVLRRDEGLLAASGALVVETGQHTGRSPMDKFVVSERESADDVWWGPTNRSLSAAHFELLLHDVRAHLDARGVFVQDLTAGSDARYAMPIRVVSELAWAGLFARNLFRPPTAAPGRAATLLRGGDDGFTVLHAPLFRADPAAHGTRSETAIVLSFSRRLILIVGTRYAGEIKKAVFTALQYLLPQQGVATMHCSANAGSSGDVALFFGLSGTGKTTLATEPARTLIGDDEHGWSDRGVFNFEGGSYAKTIGISAEAEPEIWRAVHRFGTVLENVPLDAKTREPRLDDTSLTENTRAAFPLSFLSNAAPSGLGDHPRNILFLAADAFGVLPPVARLSPEQALYWFLTGYTAKLAGTERGVREPASTFSACFGAPFLPLPPERYAELLGERIRRHQPAIWLVNTGWSGGPYGVGKRMPIALTRAVVRAVLDGALTEASTEADPHFGFRVPTVCPGVPADVLRPRDTWPDPAAYDVVAEGLARSVAANFLQFVQQVGAEVTAAGPRTGH